MLFTSLTFTLLLVSNGICSEDEVPGDRKVANEAKSSHELDQEQFMSDGGDLKGSSVDFEPSVLNSVSISEGKDAHLDCVVRNRSSFHEVSWYHIDKQLLLSANEYIKSSNPRIKLFTNGSSFSLIIEAVKVDDGGYYACRINTRPPKSQVKYLEVVVQPRFVDTSSKSETTIVVKEHENVTLSCKAVGSPTPVIKWTRDDGRPIILSPFSRSQDKYTGDELALSQVSRWMTGSFICTVFSGFSVPISRRITLLVNFPPMIMIPSQLLTIEVGFSVTLECHTESHPLARQEWHGPDGGRIVSSPQTSWKYSVTENKIYSFKVVHKLTIFQVDHSDAGQYTCVARNKLGVTRSSLTLQVTEEMKQQKPPIVPITIESTTSGHGYFLNVSKVAEEEEEPNDEEPVEMFIDFSSKNRTMKNIWAHFSTNQANGNFDNLCTIFTPFLIALLRVN